VWGDRLGVYKSCVNYPCAWTQIAPAEFKSVAYRFGHAAGKFGEALTSDEGRLS
jgi:hypothetical protein